MLAVNDQEISVACPFDDQSTQVVTDLRVLTQVDDIVPQVLPLFFGPGIVTLVGRNAIRFSVADQFQVVNRAGVQEI